jgi:hypothetical protein
MEAKIGAILLDRIIWSKSGVHIISRRNCDPVVGLAEPALPDIGALERQG